MASAKTVRVIHGGAAAKPKRNVRPKDPREAAFNIEFGKRLKSARERCGSKYTQPYVAEQMHMSKDQYIRYELGHTAFPVYLLQVLRKVLDCSILDLIDTGL